MPDKSKADRKNCRSVFREKHICRFPLKKKNNKKIVQWKEFASLFKSQGHQRYPVLDHPPPIKYHYCGLNIMTIFYVNNHKNTHIRVISEDSGKAGRCN